MKRTNKKLNQLLAALLVIAMVLTTNGINTFADSFDVTNVIEQQEELLSENNDEIVAIHKESESLEDEVDDEKNNDEDKEEITEVVSTEKETSEVVSNEQENTEEEIEESEEVELENNDTEDVNNNIEELGPSINNDEEEIEEETEYEEEPEDDIIEFESNEEVEEDIEEIENETKEETYEENEEELDNNEEEIKQEESNENEEVENESKTIEDLEESSEKENSEEETEQEEYIDNNVETSETEETIETTIESVENVDISEQSEETETIIENDTNVINQEMVDSEIVENNNLTINNDELKKLGGEEVIANIATDSIIDNDDDVDLLGVVNYGKRVVLDFGKGPNITKSDYNSYYIAGKITRISGTNKYSFTSTSGANIQSYLNVTDSSKLVTFGQGAHVKVPAFPGVTWTGYTFKGWEYEDGNDATTLEYTFGYASGDTVYKAIWNKDETYKVKATFKYLRDGASTSARTMLPQVVKSNLLPGSILSMAQKNIPGYKVKTVSYSYSWVNSTGTTVNTTGDDVLKDRNYDETHSNTDNPIVKDDNGGLSGAMPNHDITVTYYYEPDITTSKTIVCKYLDKATSQTIKAVETETIKPEEIVNRTAPSIPGYNYFSSLIEGGDTSSEATGVYPLGTYTVSGETYYHADSTKIGPNASGVFKAKMPNQSFTITYLYQQDPNTQVEVKARYKFEGLPDIVITKNPQLNTTIHFGPEGGPTGTALLAYGAAAWNPAPGTSGIEVTNFVQNKQDTQRGSFDIKVTTATPKEIIINLAYDYTRDEYWQKIALTWSPNGEIVNAPGSPAITERYVSITEGSQYHLFSELVENLTPVPETNYIFNGWYKGLDTSTGKASETKFNNNDHITIQSEGGGVVNHRYTLYGEFVKDPSKFAYLNFSVPEEMSAYGVISSGETARELITSTPNVFNWSSVAAFPTVSVTSGYELKGWKYTIGGVTNTKTEAQIRSSVTIAGTIDFYAVIEEKICDDNLCHAPIVKLNIANNGTATTTLYGVHEKRKYILADKDGKVIEMKSPNQITNGFATTLKPGVFYKCYEVKNTVADLPVGTNVSTIAAANIGEAAELHVPAVKNYSVGGNAINGFSINFTRVSGMNYALLNKDFTVAKGYDATSFTNLPSADAYILVASDNTSISPTNQSVISQGVTINTETHNLTGRKYRLVLDGGASAVGIAEDENNGDKKIYYVEGGTDVTVSGLMGGRWSIDSNNVSMNETASMQNFVMPYEDVYLTSIVPELNYAYSTFEVINNTNQTIGVRDKWNLLKEFENDLMTASTGILPTMHVADTDGLPVKFYAIFDKIGKNVNSSQYTYTIKMRLAVTVDGKIAKWNNINHNVKVVYDMPNEFLGNTNYKRYLTGSTTNLPCDYDTSDYSLVNSTNAVMVGGGSSELSVSCTKTHILKINVGGELPPSLSYIQEFNTTHDQAIATKLSEVTDEKISQILQTPDLTTARYLYDDDSSFMSQYNTVVYNCTGLYNGDNLLPDGVNTHILSNITYTLKFVKDNVREVKKELLRAKVEEAEQVTTTEQGQVPTNLTNINNILTVNVPDVTTSNTGAKHIMDFHIDYTNDEIQQTIDAIDYILTHLDPIPPVTIHIDANGGAASMSDIVGHVGEKWVVIASVSVAYVDHAFLGWNSEVDGSGTAYTVNTDVATVQNNITIYAQWQYIPPNPPPPPPPPAPRQKSGGGGGGGGGTTKRVKLDNNQAAGPMMLPTNGLTLTENSGSNVANKVYITDNVDGILFRDTTTDSNTNLYFMKVDGTFLSNTWAVISYREGDSTNSQLVNAMYYFGKDGKAASGFMVDGTNVYYLSHDNNYKFGQLKTGWIYDERAKKWYYGDLANGMLKVGYQVIDNRMYYFNPIPTMNAAGGIDMNTFNYGNGFASMQVGGYTPDGFAVNQNGEVQIQW